MGKEYRCRAKPKRFTQKDGARLAIQKAMGYVVFTCDYKGKIHVEADTTKMADEQDLAQMSLKVMESYAHNLSLAVLRRSKLIEETKRQSKLVLDAKEERSRSLRDETV